MTGESRAHRLQLIIAFATIYLFWGSTYLGIKFAIETIPPLVMAGFRFLMGGAILFVWSQFQGAARPTWTEIRHASIVGILLMVFGTGGVSWAEQYVPSGLASLLVATVPLWIVFFDWLRPTGNKPSLLTVCGLLVGTIGVTILVAPGHFAGADHINFVGAAVIVVGSSCWALGSIYSRHIPAPRSRTMSSALQLMAAGIVLECLALAGGEWTRFDLQLVSTKSLIALGYMAVFGALTLMSYTWLLRATTPARVATYAYINPIVAVTIGTIIGNEPFALRTLLSAFVIILAVVLIVVSRALQPGTSTSRVALSTENVGSESMIPAPNPD